MSKKIIAAVIAAAVSLSAAPMALAEENTVLCEDGVTMYDAYIAGERMLYDASEEFGSEWNLIAAARGEYDFRTEARDNYGAYYSAAEKKLLESGGIIDNGWGENAADYAKVVLALTASGRNVTNVGGCNLLEKLADWELARGSYISAPVYTLIALDSGDYAVPEVEGKENTTREKLIDYIIGAMVADSGWAYFGDVPDVDLTAMALQALAPYYRSNDKATTAVDKAVAWLSSAQLQSGGFMGYDSESSCSAAQVLAALCALGIDADTDMRFIKNGAGITNAISAYAVKDGFKNVISDTAANAIATQQCCYALASYYRVKDGRNSLYDMSDALAVEVSCGKNNTLKVIAPERSAAVIVKTADGIGVTDMLLNAGQNTVTVGDDAYEIYIWESLGGMMPLCEKWSR